WTYRSLPSLMNREYPPAAVPWLSSTPSAPSSGISTSAVMLCGRLSTFGAAAFGTDCVFGTYVYLSRGNAIWGFSPTIRGRPLPSMGKTSYLPASTYQVPIIAIKRSRFSSATLWFSAKSSATWYSSQPLASRAESVSDEIGSPNPFPASVNDGPGQAHTARQPSW